MGTKFRGGLKITEMKINGEAYVKSTEIASINLLSSEGTIYHDHTVTVSKIDGTSISLQYSESHHIIVIDKNIFTNIYLAHKL